MPGLISKNSPPKLGGVPSPKGEGGGSLLEPPPPSLTSFEASPCFLRLRAIALALRAGSRFAVREATLTPEELRLGRLFPSSAEDGRLRGQKSREATLARADGVVLVNPPIIRC